MSKDRITKYRINSFSTITRGYGTGAKKLFEDIKKRFYDQILLAKKNGKPFCFTTDGNVSYKKSFNKYLYNVAKLVHGISIKAKIKGRTKNNNCIERDHQYSRSIEKRCRGHKDLEGISALFDIGDVYYNYIDKQKLKYEKKLRTPAERAKIDLKLGDKHQLLKLIKCAYVED